MSVTQQQTELDRIVKKLRTVLRRETSDVILAGDLLRESREFLDHGEWQDWLSENFDLSYRTALRYVTVAEYAERQKCHVSHLSNLSTGVLYQLAGDKFTEGEEAEILAQAKAGQRIDRARALAIRKKLAPPPPAPPPAEPPPDDDDDDDDESDDEPDDESEDESDDEPDAESEEILAGPAPDVPLPAPSAPTNFALQDFDEAIDTLKLLMTKPSSTFVGTAHTAYDLEGVEAFIRAVIRVRSRG